MGEAILVGGRMGAIEQKIYKWKQYKANETTTYYWNRNNAVATTNYVWAKYNALGTFTWNVFDTIGSGTITERVVPYVVNVGPTSLIHYSSGCRVDSVYHQGIYTKNQLCNLWLEPHNPGKLWIASGSKQAGDSLSGYIWTGSGDNGYDRSTTPGWYKDNTKYYYKYLVELDKIVSISYPTSWESSSGDTKWNYGSMTCTTKSKIYFSWSTYTKQAYMGNSETMTTPVTGSSIGLYPADGVKDGYWYTRDDSATVWEKGTTNYGNVTSTNSGAYPANGVSGSYWYTSAGSNVTYSKGSTVYSQVSSTSSSAYPSNGHSGSYWYTYDRLVVTYSQGTYDGDRISTDRDRFPDNGYQDGYWYVFDGEA